MRNGKEILGDPAPQLSNIVYIAQTLLRQADLIQITNL
jgi:hypothetical protein